MLSGASTWGPYTGLGARFRVCAGVELSRGLRTRKLLILGNCHKGQKGPIARSIVRLLYENAFRLEVLHWLKRKQLQHVPR